MSDDTYLKSITPELAKALHSEVERGTTDANTPLEAILKLNQKGGKKSRKKPDPIQIVLMGEHEIYNDEFTVLFYRLVQLKDPKIDELLTNAHFTMADIKGKPIYPREAPKVVAPAVEPKNPS